MKMPAKSFIKLAICTTAGISLVSLLTPQPSWAQNTTTNVNPLDDLSPQQNTNPFSARDQGEAMNGIMDLMHRAQMGNIRSSSEYSTEQNQNLNDAAAKFRQRQLEMIRNQNSQNQASPANSVKTP
jgi:hypothetical protein